MALNPVTAKLGLFALDQIAKWTETYLMARGNPDMTEEEADALVAQTMERTVEVSDEWRKLREES